MNFLSKIMGGFILSSNRLIGRLNRRTIRAIRQGFFFIVFLLSLVGIIMGVRMGREAAQVKSSPLIENINDAFELDIKRQREDGNFSSMLDSDMVNELKKTDIDKIKFPSKENLEPEMESGIVEPKSDEKVRVSQDMRIKDELFEGDYRHEEQTTSEVRPLDKRKGPAPDDTGKDVRTDIRDSSPLERQSDSIDTNYDAGDNKIRPRTNQGGEMNLRPISRDEGIIEH